jgi:hypothetical protein
MSTNANRTHEALNQKAAVGILPESSMYEAMVMPDTTAERCVARERSSIVPVNGKRTVRLDVENGRWAKMCLLIKRNVLCFSR